MRLTAGLLRCATSRGCQLFTPVQLSEVVASSRKVAMVTSDAIELEARVLVFATGYELADGVPLAGHRRTMTWAFATPPQPQAIWSDGELIWEASDPYLYIRTTVGGRILVGGEDENMDDEALRDALLPEKIRTLQGKAKELLPWIDVSADFAWAGTFGESQTGMPSIGPVPAMPNCYAVRGYGGNGLTFAMVAAQITKGLVCGDGDPDMELFDFAQ
jgi:glycine/D-amino acid oxidase-like deaminating enzyme